ncbi:transcription elongation factor tfiis [Anaeramoeba ignava]|uniref:Transcription elongation factor tfiis n=1 Tax=Anaeramoeba ignava TaxID=1746090 RepID=A0A9Q0R605_ANAIG|nr:transcription elongation factor tfiis [Anaeramoeba ignava]
MSITQEDIIQIKQEIAKIQKQDPQIEKNEEKVIDMINRLNEMNMNLDILKKTKIGFIINKLRGNTNQKVQTEARKLFTKWRKIYENSKNKNNKNSETNSPSIKKQTKIVSDGINQINSTGNPQRNRFQNLLCEDLKKIEAKIQLNNQLNNQLKNQLKNSTGFQKTAEFLAEEIENALFEIYGEVNDKYKEKYRKIGFILTENKSVREDIKRKIFSGEITPKEFCEMKDEDFMTSEKKQEIKDLEKQAFESAMAPQPTQVTTTEFRCGRCGKRQCKVWQRQTRSADEPATTYVQCTNCLNMWKF